MIDLAGTITGTSNASASSLIKRVILLGSLNGSLEATAPLYRKILVGGQVQGIGAFQDLLSIFVSGTTEGQGTAEATLYRVLPLRGRVEGQGRIQESPAWRFGGCGLLSGYLDVRRVPPPVSHMLRPIPSFRWGHEFEPDDLMLALVNSVGTPYAPASIFFRMLRVVQGGVFPVGPQVRKPVTDPKRLGVYHASGVAGELGQPGRWVIEWQWKQYSYTPIKIERRPFVVLDAVALNHTPGKNGW